MGSNISEGQDSLLGFLEIFDGLLDVLFGSLGLSSGLELHENLLDGVDRVVLEHLGHSLHGRVAGSERIGDSSRGGSGVGSSSHDRSNTSGKLSVDSHDVSVMSADEASGLHDSEHFVDHPVMMGSSVMDNSVESVHEMHVGDLGIHVTLAEVDVSDQEALDLSNPAEVSAVHSRDEGSEGGSELGRVDMLLQDGEHLVEKLLLMQVVELQGGVHLVDDGVLMNKSWELSHDGGDKVPIVSETNMDVVARHDFSSPVHAHVELGIDTVDFDVFDLMRDGRSVGDNLTSSRVGSHGDGSDKS